MTALPQKLLEVLVEGPTEGLYIDKAKKLEGLVFVELSNAKNDCELSDQVRLYCLYNVLATLVGYMERLSADVDAHDKLDASFGGPLKSLIEYLDHWDPPTFEDALITALSCNPPFTIFK